MTSRDEDQRARQMKVLEAYARTLPPGPIELTDQDLIERFRRPVLSDEEIGARKRLLQAEQLLRNAKRAGFL
jgi:hypothetical protein